MSDLTPCTKLSREEAKAALIAWYEERTGKDWPSQFVLVLENGTTYNRRIDGNPFEDLNLLALITGAMKPEELTAYVREMASAHDAVKYSNSGYVTWARFLLTADAPTRATAALMALGLEGEMN